MALPQYHQPSSFLSSNGTTSITTSSSSLLSPTLFSVSTSNVSSSTSRLLASSRILSSGSVSHPRRFRSTPRFGHSNRFSDLFSPHPEVTNDYVVGLLVSALILLSLFVIWGFLLIVFKCCVGSKRVGFLSGSPFVFQTAKTTTTTTSSNKIKGKESDEKGDNRGDGGGNSPDEVVAAAAADEEAVAMMMVPNPWMETGRMVFASSCCCVIVFGIVLATVGIGNLDQTSTSVGYGARLGYDYLSGAQGTLYQVIDLIELLVVMKSNLQNELKDFFFDLIAAKVAHKVFGNVEIAMRILNEALEELGNFLEPILRSINHTLKDGQQTCQDVHDVTEQINLLALQVGVGLTITIIPMLLLFCLYWNVYHCRPHPPGGGGTTKLSTTTATTTTTTTTKIIHCFQRWFIWPCFVTGVILSMISCCGIIIAGMLNADFCSGGDDLSPDSTIIEIMDNIGMDPNSFEYTAIVYLVRDCNVSTALGGNPLKDVEAFQRELNVTLVDVAYTIDTIISAGIELLEMETGYDTSILVSHLQEFDVQLKDLWALLELFINSLACRPLYNAYYMVTHRAACTDSYTGTFWVFLSLLFISFFGLMAITFRSALYPPVLAEDLDFDWDLELKEEEVVEVEQQEEVAVEDSVGSCHDGNNNNNNMDSGSVDINNETEKVSPSSEQQQQQQHEEDCNDDDNKNPLSSSADGTGTGTPTATEEEDGQPCFGNLLCNAGMGILTATEEEHDHQPSFGTSNDVVGVEVMEENETIPIKVVPLLKGNI